ncbi:PaaI family thioesterase [Amaricoccus macauensis]|uniref:PaaI family thioesterase n=1 Tax=Amaricoccus macauensis TaxID=57001 RepID=UPI003C7E18C7
MSDETIDWEARLALAQEFTNRIPHSQHLGMRIDEIAPARAVVSLPYDESLVGDPETGVVHGGVITALLDTCSGAAVLCHPDTGFSTATIDLRIDYMRPATPEKRIIARAECYRMTRYVAFVQARAFVEGEDEPVAAARGAFTVERKQETA